MQITLAITSVMETYEKRVLSHPNHFPSFSTLFLVAAPCFTLLLTVFFITVPVRAADVGWCGTPEEMTALLRSEGQRSLIHGNDRIPWNPNNGIGGLIFTADPEGRVGYMIHADKPMGTRAAKMCIADRMHNVRLYDARAETIPEETLVKSTASAAEQRCARLVQQKIVAEGSCGFHNEGLARSARFGERVALQAYGATKQSDGSYRTDKGLITVTLIMPGKGMDKDGNRTPERDGRGVITFTALPEGADIIGSAFIMGTYTPYAQELLDAKKDGKQVSALVQPR